jgi:conjugative relaxase-like TrwC/TraI family protein
MSLGTGYEYLMSSVARGDGAAPSSQPLTRYYLESGTPPGRFLGTGLAGLADGAGVAIGTEVSEDALWHLLGMMSDPVTGKPLGRRPLRLPTPLRQRLADRIASLPASLSSVDRAAAEAAITVEEQRREARIGRAVAGFDLTFSVPKSVSVLWALADAGTQATIHQAHRDAIDLALAWAEQNVAFTRVGAGGRVQVPVSGLIGAAFDHWDSRAGDPHLHTHVVVANRVQTADGTWRALDGATLFRYTVALSELHEGVLQDLLTERLGVTWTTHPRRHSIVPRWDIDGIPTALLDEFSARSRAIAVAKDDLVAAFVAQHGRHPSNVETLKLRQQATLQTRPNKTQHSLAEQMAAWRTRAAEHADAGSVRLSELQRNAALPALTSDTIEAGMLDALAAAALAAVASKRAVFGEANLLAEIHRQLHGARFLTVADRLTVAEHIADRALGTALPLDPPAAEIAPHRGAARYTTTTILDAETRLLDAGRDLDAPVIDFLTTAGLTDTTESLSEGQREAITSIATSGRALDLLVGPAGSGKTTTLAALKTAWEHGHGPGTVIGLAPSAAAAQVLTDELGITCENTAKWLVEQDRNRDRDAQIDALEREIAAKCGSPSSALARELTAKRNAIEAEQLRWSIQPGQLVIIDEASLAGTLTLDAIITDAHDVYAKVLLVGDWAQLGAIEAGGAFHMLATDRPDTPTLSEIHRFTEAWEADASLQLRAGDDAAVAAYLDHDRVHSGDRDQMLHQLVDAWHTDTQHGLDSIMITADQASVHDLNTLAQSHQRDSGKVQPGDTPLADGHTAGIGDQIVTRRNDRRLTTGDQWVKNGNNWTVIATHADGRLTVSDDKGRDVQLAADYVRDHVELGYATTVHRAQGRTVDAAHALIDDTATRESLYVAATRARAGNHLYLTAEAAGDSDDLSHERATGNDVDRLARILEQTASTASAHAYLEKWAGLPDLPAYNTNGSRTQRIDHGTPPRSIGV